MNLANLNVCFSLLPPFRIQPPSLSHVDAAGVPLAALTSYQSLLAGSVKAGDRVLILGGSGGTGYLGVQFAKAMGATVAATGSDEEFLRSCGADEVCARSLEPLDLMLRFY